MPHDHILSLFEAMNATPEQLLAYRKDGRFPPMRGGDNITPGDHNTFVLPSIVSRLALATLYNQFLFAPLISRDHDMDFAGAQGDTITIRKPAVFVANRFTRPTGIVLQDAKEDKMTVTLDHLYDVSASVTSEEILLDITSLQDQIITPMCMALVQQIDRDIADAIAAAAVGTGGGGTVSAVAGAAWTDTSRDSPQEATAAFLGAREKLTRNKLPLPDRNAVLSPEGVTQALSDPQFVRASYSGNQANDALRQAIVGRAFGMDVSETGVLGYGEGGAGTSDGLAFHKSAVTMVSRPLQPPQGVAPNMVSVESFRGLSLRTVYHYDTYQKTDVISIDTLVGYAATRPQGAVVLNFGQGS